jgi:hypothetical protein
MKRDDLLDNLAESMRRGEVVTLTLRPLGGRNDAVKTGRILAIAEHYTGRAALQVVLTEVGHTVPLVVGLSMIKDFQVGRPPRDREAPQRRTPRVDYSKPHMHDDQCGCLARAKEAAEKLPTVGQWPGSPYRRAYKAGSPSPSCKR